MKKTFAAALAVTLGLALAGVAAAARNSSGTFSFSSVAGGYPWTPNQTISSSGVGANFVEISNGFSDSLSRSGKGGMQAPLACTDGSASLPAITWNNDTNSGFYRIGADNIGIALGGVKSVDLAPGLSQFTDPVSTPTVVAPVLGTIGSGLDASIVASTSVGFVVKADGTNDNKSRRLVNVATPTSAQDSATKAYVDQYVGVSTELTVDVPSITAGSCAEVSGTASVSISSGHDCVAILPTSAATGLFVGAVTISGTSATVRFCASNGGSAVDPGALTYRFRCFKQ